MASIISSHKERFYISWVPFYSSDRPRNSIFDSGCLRYACLDCLQSEYLRTNVRKDTVHNLSRCLECPTERLRAGHYPYGEERRLVLGPRDSLLLIFLIWPEQEWHWLLGTSWPVERYVLMPKRSRGARRVKKVRPILVTISSEINHRKRSNAQRTSLGTHRGSTQGLSSIGEGCQ